MTSKNFQIIIIYIVRIFMKITMKYYYYKIFICKKIYNYMNLTKHEINKIIKSNYMRSYFF